jgi:predicted transcriptional regulator
MIEQLFGSKTRVKLLKLFFSNPNRSFYVREITRMIDEQINSVRRELANLLSLGLITSDSTNNKLYYEVNQEYEHYAALQAMFTSDESKAKDSEDTSSKKKTSKKSTQSTRSTSVSKKESREVALPEAEKWRHTGNIYGIAYSGAYTRDDTVPVDILVIGDVNIAQIEAVIVELEKEKSRELRYAVISHDEWKYRAQVRDKFWLQFEAAKKQIVFDKGDVFTNK